ncbi:MAG: PKD-like family lipoprotein [Prevotella sp.]
MKNRIFQIAIVILTAVVPTGCFDDDSTTGTETIKETIVTGMDGQYVKTAYVGEHLVIAPDVQSSCGDERMTYTWLLLDQNTGKEDAKGNVPEPTVIGQAKNLDYEVALAPGTYEIRFVATADNGYTVYATSTLIVRTLFSQGFYILKETADGQTDLDLFTFSGDKGDDLITQIEGQPLQGKPLGIYPNYQMNYINPDNDKVESTNAITVTTDAKVIHISRVADFKTIYTRDNICYDTMASGEQPYATYLSATFGYTLMLTSNGLYYTNSAIASTSSTGQFGLPQGKCSGSRYFYIDQANYGCGALWDAEAHSLMSYNYNLEISPLLYGDLSGEEETQQLAGTECLHCGYNRLAGRSTGLFVLGDASGKRSLYLTSGSFFGVELTKCVALPTGSHAAKATAYSTNGISASYLYCIDGGKLYAHVFNSDDGSEQELKPEGIPADETMTYVTNLFWNPIFSPGDPFEYLVVATQKGNTYKLYFYQTNGGAPIGTPVLTTEGTGTVRSVRFMNDGFEATDGMFGQHVYNIND